MIRIADSASVSDRGRRVAADELRIEAARVAGSLRACGLQRGDRVLVIGSKSVDLAVLALAVPQAGNVLIAPYHGLSGGQLRHIVDDSTPAIAVTLESATRTARESIEGMVSTVRYRDLLDGSGPGLERGHARAADPAMIVYTSGSTGPPKGVVFSNENLALGAESVGTFYGLRPEDRVLCLLPFSFDAGINQLLSSLAAGSQAVLRDYLLPQQTATLCAEELITVLTGVPALWRELARAIWPVDARNAMRLWASTGGDMPVDLSSGLRELFPLAEPLLMYGFTEAFRASYLPAKLYPVKPTSIGRPIPHSGVAVVRPDGRLCRPEEVGELVQFGPLVSLGYWNRPVESARKFAPITGRARKELESSKSPFDVPKEYLDNVAWSGDHALVDRDGVLYFQGRATSLIKSRGFRVSPTEIEQACRETGLVEDIVALGLQQSGADDVIAVVAKPKTNVDKRELLRALATLVPHYQMPGLVVMRDSLPITPTGKYNREAIKKEALAEMECTNI